MDSPPSIASTRLRAAQRLLVLIVAVLGMLAATTTVASALTTSPLRSSRIKVVSAAETRVGVAATPIGTRVGLRPSIVAGQVGQRCPRFVQMVVGSCVATRTVGKVGDEVITTADDAFTHGNKYHPRIRERALQDPVGHNFPYSYDDVILRSTPVTQADGSLLYRVPGAINGKNGFFEIALNPQTKTRRRLTVVAHIGYAYRV